MQVHSQLHGEFEVRLGYVRPRERREEGGGRTERRAEWGRERGIRKGRGRGSGMGRRDRETQSYWIGQAQGLHVKLEVATTVTS